MAAAVSSSSSCRIAIAVSFMDEKANKQTNLELQGWAHLGLLWDALGRSRDGFIVSFVRGLKGLTS